LLPFDPAFTVLDAEAKNVVDLQKQVVLSQSSPSVQLTVYTAGRKVKLNDRKIEGILVSEKQVNNYLYSITITLSNNKAPLTSALTLVGENDQVEMIYLYVVGGVKNDKVEMRSCLCSQKVSFF
jgi:hypothetical protein